MPSKSKKQHNLMAAVAHNPAFAKKAKIPQSVDKEFIAADKGRKFARGGSPNFDRYLSPYAPTAAEKRRMQVGEQDKEDRIQKRLADYRAGRPKPKGLFGTLRDVGTALSGGVSKRKDETAKTETPPVKSAPASDSSPRQAANIETMKRAVAARNAMANKPAAPKPAAPKAAVPKKSPQMQEFMNSLGEDNAVYKRLKERGFAKGGKVDGVAQRGKTRGRYI